MKIKNFIYKFKTEFLYLIFGVLTTVLNIVCYYLLYNYANLTNILSTVVAWLISVVFAFFTNKKIVFDSKKVGIYAKLKEFIFFIMSRILTGMLDVGIMFVAIDIYNLSSLLWKILSNIIVIILNYILGKLIFKNIKKEDN